MCSALFCWYVETRALEHCVHATLSNGGSHVPKLQGKKLRSNKWKICHKIPASHLHHVENLIKTLLRANALIQFNHFSC